jgi:NAD(P)-dependent dehydrogenase (short-subunit alcohol dehydrogenase family)
MKVAIVGGTGTLGRKLAREFRTRGHDVRILSRNAPEYRVNLATGEGLEAALAGREVVIEHVPAGYFKVKAQQEDVVEHGQVPWTIVRATQFHELAAATLESAARYRVLPVPQVRNSVRGGRAGRCETDSGTVRLCVTVYRPLRHPVSSLALGPRGWVQTANFAVTGVLCLGGAAGLRLAGGRLAGSRTGPVMVAAAGAGLIGSAAFRTDPVGGYPPGTPEMPARFSRAGTAHNLAAVPVFFGLPAAAACYGWRSWRAGQPPGFAVYCAAIAVTMPVAMALAGAGFGQPSRLGGYGGLFQRASIIAGFAWLTVVSARGLPGTAATP